MKTLFIIASSPLAYVRRVLMRARQTAVQDEQIAHVLRRCGFGVGHGEVHEWRDRGVAELIEWLLDNEDVHALADEDVFEGLGDPDELDEDELLTVLLDQMMLAPNQLHERIVWYWHTHFTSSSESSNLAMAWRQHHLIRRHAFGNFAKFARAITTDAAMLIYLDGGGSYGDNPNENYAREFLELFTLGHDGGYSEDDVRAAARIFSGWHVDWETGGVNFDPDTHYDRPVTFMGKRRRWTVDSLVEFVCDLPACHQHVVTRMYHHLVGPDLSETRRDELAAAFAASDLNIKALLGEILRGDDFLRATHSRACQPLEWALAALRAIGFSSVTHAEVDYWQFSVLGQVPYRPPNVAGWPLDDRWASTSQIIARTSVLLDWELPESTVNTVAPTVDAVLARCGIHDPSPSTRAALDAIESTYSEFDYRLELLFITALTSPEFTLL